MKNNLKLHIFLFSLSLIILISFVRYSEKFTIFAFLTELVALYGTIRYLISIIIEMTRDNIKYKNNLK